MQVSSVACSILHDVCLNSNVLLAQTHSCLCPHYGIRLPITFNLSFIKVYLCLRKARKKKSIFSHAKCRHFSGSIFSFNMRTKVKKSLPRNNCRVIYATVGATLGCTAFEVHNATVGEWTEVSHWLSDCPHKQATCRSPPLISPSFLHFMTACWPTTPEAIFSKEALLDGQLPLFFFRFPWLPSPSQ